MVYIKQIINLPGLTPEMWTESHEERIKDFLRSTERKLLTFYVDNDHRTDESDATLVIKFEIPSNVKDQFLYLVKSYYSREIHNREEFQKCMQFFDIKSKWFMVMIHIPET
jgi:hypothetical protein